MTRKSWADLKKMWITYDEGGAPLDVFYKEHPGAVGWVRADLVDGLVEAFGNWKNARTLGNRHLEMENIEAALKAMEEQ